MKAHIINPYRSGTIVLAIKVNEDSMEWKWLTPKGKIIDLSQIYRENYYHISYRRAKQILHDKFKVLGHRKMEYCIHQSNPREKIINRFIFDIEPKNESVHNSICK